MTVAACPDTIYNAELKNRTTVVIRIMIIGECTVTKLFILLHRKRNTCLCESCSAATPATFSYIDYNADEQQDEIY